MAQLAFITPDFRRFSSTVSVNYALDWNYGLFHSSYVQFKLFKSLLIFESCSSDYSRTVDLVYQ